MRAVDASPSLQSKRDLIEDVVDSVSVNGAGDEQWQVFVAAKREAALEALLAEHLRPELARDFLAAALRDGQLRTTATAMTPQTSFGRLRIGVTPRVESCPRSSWLSTCNSAIVVAAMVS